MRPVLPANALILFQVQLDTQGAAVLADDPGSILGQTQGQVGVDLQGDLQVSARGLQVFSTSSSILMISRAMLWGSIRREARTRRQTGPGHRPPADKPV